MYKYILFDADDTLLDFKQDERNAFFALFKEKNLPCGDDLYAEYSKINLDLWKRFERREIDKKYIMDHRFTDFLEKEGIGGDGKDFNNRYCFHLSEGGVKIKNADKVCSTLKAKGYKLYIITNGVKYIQDKRFKKSGLIGYFEYCFISESVGYQKPMPEFFDVVFEKLGDCDRSKYLVVGDSLTSDIKGGKNAGIDTCWFNVSNIRNDADIVPDYTIYELNELLNIL
ncbi:MAG: YjjG family noncanonical pyrimidine nucleotidase [Acutalibacteraceae bacterium]